MAAQGGTCRTSGSMPCSGAALTRAPDRDEVAQLCEVLSGTETTVRAKELDAAKIAGAGAGEASERAAWTVLARVLLNLDEAVTKG